MISMHKQMDGDEYKSNVDAFRRVVEGLDELRSHMSAIEETQGGINQEIKSLQNAFQEVVGRIERMEAARSGKLDKSRASDQASAMETVKDKASLESDASFAPKSGSATTSETHPSPDAQDNIPAWRKLTPPSIEKALADLNEASDKIIEARVRQKRALVSL
jgi:hypothetical protein